MTRYQRSIAERLLAIAFGVLLALFLVFVLPHIGFGESKCPEIPAGYLSPEGFLGTGWEVVELQKDQTYGLYWFFVKSKNPGSAVIYGNLIMAAGVDWPVFYNYLENGSLRFLRLMGDRSKYIVDPDVTADDYNAVAEYYQRFFGVLVAPRTGA